MHDGAGMWQRRGKNEEECERRIREAEVGLGFGRRDEGRRMDGGTGVCARCAEGDVGNGRWHGCTAKKGKE